MLKTITAGLLALLAAMTPAHAADIGVNWKCDDGTIDKANCGYYYIDGEILRGDGKKFREIIASTANIGVDSYLFLRSPGGVFEDGMDIAKVVHNWKFRTDASDVCTSMCAIIWLAGTTRYYGGKARIGFHSISAWPTDSQGNRIKNGKPTPYNGGNALVGAFFHELGFNDKTIEALTDAVPSSMFYLNGKRLEELDITAKRKSES
jgi:hypothetical protein